MTITHTFVSSNPQGSDASLVSANEWNAAHTIADSTVTHSQLAFDPWPVGSIFISAVSTNPNTLLGFGTWSSIGAGQVLIGVDTNDSDFNSAGLTGGAKTKAISSHTGTAVADHPAHTHSVTSNVAVGNHTPTQPTIAWPAGVPTASGTAISDHASHTHTYTDVVNHTHPHNMQGSTSGSTTGTNVMGSTATGGSSRAMAIATSNPSGGVSTGTTAGPSATLTHTVSAQPTIAWPAGVPTASGGGVDAHSVTNNAVTSGNPSATLTHGVSQPNDHTALNVVQPYLTCYFWQRTA